MKIKSETLRYNTAKALLAIYRKKAISRIEIAKQTGLTPASVTHIINDLLNENKIIETGEEVRDFSGSGRSRKLLTLNPTYGSLIGIEINMKGIFLVVTDTLGRLSYQTNLAINAFAVADINQQIIKLIQGAINALPGANILAAGIAIPGHLNLDTQTILTNNEKWQHFNLNIINKEFAFPFVAENNIESMALSEYLFHSEKSPEKSLFLHVGHGIFCSLFDGQQLGRRSNPYIGEIGHTVFDIQGAQCECGKNGCLQTYISDTWLINKSMFLFNNSNNSVLNSIVNKADEITIKVIADSYLLGDSYLKPMIDKGLFLLATSIANTLLLHDANKIYMNSDLLNYHHFKDGVIEQIHSQLDFIPRKNEVEIEVLPMGPMRGAVGGAALASLTSFVDHVGF